MLKLFKKILSLVMCTVILGVSLMYVYPKSVYAANTTYYVDSVSGNDNNNGTSTSTPWQSLNKVNSVTFEPGDRILFKSGCSWTGTLFPKGSGTAANRITFDKYGTGAAPLINGNGGLAGIRIQNIQYVTVQNFEVTNDAPTEAQRHGILIVGQGAGLLNGIYVLNNNVHNVKGISTRDTTPSIYDNAGIYFTVWTGGTGALSSFNDIRIEGNSIHDLTCGGILSMATQQHLNDTTHASWYTNVVVRNNVINRTGADGIDIGYLVNGLIEYNVAYDVGYNSAECKYIAGMWCWATDDITFQYNEVARVRSVTPSVSDSKAFDVDVWSYGTHIFQYNYSHDNAGGFFMTVAPSNHCLPDEILVRYNISQNDRHSGNWSDSTINVMTDNVYIYNNVFFENVGEGFKIRDKSNLYFYNNIFYSTTPGSYPQGPTYDYNCFYGHAGPAKDIHKIVTNPMFVNPGTGTDGRTTVDGYKLQSSSPCINKGKVILNNGGKDYWGNPLYNGLPDIGAFEYTGTIPGVVDGQAYTPIADSYVRDGSYATNNYGTANLMEIKKDVSGMNRKSYLKFNYSTFNGVSANSAKLRFRVNSSGSDATRTIKVYGTSVENWIESGTGGINWNNAPAGTTLIASVNVTNTAGAWYEVDVTSYINSQMADKLVSFLLINEGTSSANGGISIHTREAAADSRPVLILESKYTSIADAYVRDGTSYANTNYGTATPMEVKSDVADGYRRKAYVKFDFSNYAGTGASSAILRLKVHSTGTDATRAVSVYGTSVENWIESGAGGITWNNAPAGTTYIGGMHVTNVADTWYEVDVTDYINSQMSDKVVSFLIINEYYTSPNNMAKFYAKETAGSAPELLIK